MTLQLTPAERLTLLMLCDVHEALKIKNSFDPAFIRDAILGGHLWAFGWEYPGIDASGEIDQAVVKEVNNVLQMWEQLEQSYAALSPAGKADLAKNAHPFGANVSFLGFDGNNETEHMSVARFLVERLNRWTHFQGRDFNSHMPSLASYRRMLAVYEPIVKAAGYGKNLSVDQLADILNA